MINRWLPVVALVAALALVATAEYQLALIAGWPPVVAWCAPIVVDAYVLAAFRARRDIPWALGLLSATVAASHALPVIYPDGLPWFALAGISVVPGVVMWRVHELARPVPRPAPVKRPPVVRQEPARSVAARPSAAPERPRAPKAPPVASTGLTDAAREAGERIRARGERVNRTTVTRELRSAGHTVANATAGPLVAAAKDSR